MTDLLEMLRPPESAEPSRPSMKAPLAAWAAWFWARVHKGVRCPLCTQYAKVYPRHLNASVATVLRLIHDATGDGSYAHVPSLINERFSPKAAAALRGDFAKLEHWSVIERKPGDRDDGSKRTGFWRVTETGKAFVRGDFALPRTVFLYDGHMRNGSSGSEDAVTFQEALESGGFDYSAVMRPAPSEAANG